MYSECAEIERLQKMVREGKLSPEEAERLQATLRSQQARDEAFSQANVDRRRGKKQLSALLGLCFLFFFLGIGSSWLLTPSSSILDAQNISIEQNQTSGGRLVDLANIQKERAQTMSQAIKLSGTVATLVVAAIVGVIVVLLYNGLVDARERVNGGWAQVENVYQRRLDLVPVLIDGVKTYVEHERDTLTALTEARANALSAQTALAGKSPATVEQMRAIETAQGGVGSALSRLFAVVENYPDLKASQNFLTLQDQIEGTENRVAMERRAYNDFSRVYNTNLQKFPHNLVAMAMGFDSKPYFQAENEALKGLKDPFDRNKK